MTLLDFINLKPTQNFIIINPRIFTVIFKFVIIVDKIKKNIFIQKLEITVIFSQFMKYFLLSITI